MTDTACDCSACQLYATTRRCTCRGPRPCPACKAYKRHTSAEERVSVLSAPLTDRNHANRYDPVACLASSREALAETEAAIVQLLAEREALPASVKRHPWSERLNQLRRNAKRHREAVTSWEARVAALQHTEREHKLCST